MLDLTRQRRDSAVFWPTVNPSAVGMDRAYQPLQDRRAANWRIYVVLFLLAANAFFAWFCYGKFIGFRQEVMAFSPQVWQKWETSFRTLAPLGGLLGLCLVAATGLLLWDITREKRQSNASIRRSQERYRLLAELTPLVGIVRFNLADRQWLDANRTALIFFGRTRTAFVGDDIKRSFHEEDQARVEESLASLCPAQPTVNFSCRARFHASDFRETEWSVSLLEQKDVAKEAVAVFMDVAEKKKNELLRLEQEKLCGVLEMAGAAAHEFNQPIQIITGLLWMLRTKKFHPNRETELLTKIEGEIHKMASLGRKVAQISRYAVKPYAGDIHIIDIEKASEEQEENEAPSAPRNQRPPTATARPTRFRRHRSHSARLN